MRFCKWCQRQGIASAVFFSVTVAAAVYAEGPQGGGLTDSVVTDLHTQSPNSPASIQQVSDEEAVPAPQKLIDPVVVASQAMESPESSSPIPDVPLPEASYQYSGSATAPQAAPCSCCNSTCRTKKKKEAATAAMKAAFGIVFYDNNFSYLNDKCYDGLERRGVVVAVERGTGFAKSGV